MLWLLSGPQGFVYLLDFFCSDIQFYLCLIPFLYLDLHILGCNDKLGAFHANQTSKCLDPHLNKG